MPVGKSARRKTLSATSKAIKRIKNAALRREFLNLAVGAEVGLASRKKSLTTSCMNRLVILSFSLNRTISPRVAAGVLNGLSNDARKHAVSLSLKTKKGSVCVVGDSPEKSKCKAKPGSECYTIPGQPGCGGPSGFYPPWDIGSE
jgi:hypothetical protein